MVSIRKLAFAAAAVLSLVGCATSSEKLPDATVPTADSKIADIQKSSMPEPAKQAAIGRIKAEEAAHHGQAPPSGGKG